MRRLSVLVVVACGHSRPPMESQTDMRPPVAATHPHVVTSPNGDRDDPYFWLRDDTRKDPAVLAHLRDEMAYTGRVMQAAAPLEKQLFDELAGHLDDDHAAPPVLDNGFLVYKRFERGREQPIIARKKATAGATEEIVLDGNQLARGHDYYKLAAWSISRDGRLVAWLDDVVGRRQFQLHVKELATGTILPDTAAKVGDSLVWANDNKTVFFIGKDAVTLREDSVHALVIGGGQREVYREPDTGYYVSVKPTKSRRYVQIVLDAIREREVRIIDADAPDTPPRVVLPRELDHLYDLDHVDGRFVIRTNDHAPNYRVVTVPDGSERDRKAWRDVIPAHDHQLVESVVAYRDVIAATVRQDGYRRVVVVAPGKPPMTLPVHERASTAMPIDTPDEGSHKLRWSYSSMVTPETIFELDVDTGAQLALTTTQVPHYDPSRYTTAVLHARAPDGAEIPISIAYRKDTKLDGHAPIELHGYGSHGISSEPEFDLRRLPLLDRGWVVAIAHIRGGQELGRAWWDGGIRHHKRNTFTDFIAATEAVVAQHIAARDQVFAAGTSAGGLVMGVIANERPELYRGIYARVPFVDVVTSMLDESLPLTTNEFDVWGNPKVKADYDYMLSYSPYDNVGRKAYPAMFVKTGLWDSQVQYFEPTKWVAKLRAMKTDTNPIVLDVDLESGHGGRAGRLARLREWARYEAFMLMVHAQPDPR